MSTAVNPATITRLAKAAADNGFDQELPRHGDWLGFASTHAPLRVWLSVAADGLPLLAFSQINVARALADGAEAAVVLPPGTVSARAVADVPSLHRLLRRAFQLSRTLPDELLHAFEKKTEMLPRSTEAERLVVQRVGQDVFRAGLLDFWEGRCAMTGLAITELLRASHIKPWAHCGTDAERLDVFNGFLLAPHLDAAFDCGLITVADGGEVLVSQLLSGADRAVLGLTGALRVNALADGHKAYLPWHRERIFQDSQGRQTREP